jgi:hypothetical protein
MINGKAYYTYTDYYSYSNNPKNYTTTNTTARQMGLSRQFSS